MYWNVNTVGRRPGAAKRNENHIYISKQYNFFVHVMFEKSMNGII